ncbi:hypothetical protein EFA69_19775 [Rufibacter immobilis]|uniref:Uncharacterized protein n=1 Tax=Rufibacter immobilis TaxID=1348778 RepID=A0A3M9MSW0_9BACT|nr:DUF6169 family protein [Rufibacter immobilis]RNI28297.1 hypothetical protein EFA69_19775 [Rufibacter immobilis]
MSLHYNLDKQGIGYSFITDKGVRYYAYFEAYQEFFTEYPLIKDLFFTFNFDVADLGENKRRPKDDNGRTKATISLLLESFFKEDLDRVLITVCDSSDNMHGGRKRIFDTWYSESKSVLPLTKINGFNSTEDMEVHSSLIFHSTHIYKDNIISAYEQVRDGMFIKR